MERGALHDNHEIIRATHEVAGFDLLEPAYPFGEPIESAFALGCDFHFDQSPNLIFPGCIRMKNGPPTEQNVLGLQPGEVGLDGSRFARENSGHLLRAEALA